ncbi:MAG: biopolymer transporter ExbD, partial [Betaproteobacteria bacterium]
MAILARRNGPRRRMLADINVVPYLDVMLVLVVILMVSAPFVNPSLVNLPSVGK